MDGTDMGKEDLPDFSDVPGKHFHVFDHADTFGQLQVFRLEREVKQWLKKASPATMRNLDYILWAVVSSYQND